MKYIVNKVDAKIAKTGKAYLRVSLTDESGQQYNDVAVFSFFNGYKDVDPGKEIEGIIEEEMYQGSLSRKLVNMKGLPAFAQARPASGAVSAAKITSQSVKDAQERKNESIAWFSSIDKAVAIVGQYTPEQWENEQVYKETIEYWRDWLLEEWKAYEAADYKTKHNAA